MRSLSAFLRFALCLVSLAPLSCAASKPEPPAVETSVSLEGEVTLAGSRPLEERIVLADAGGGFCTLRSMKLEYELRSLAGHRVRVTGRLMGRVSRDPEFLVETYSLLPVNGRKPVIGSLESRDGGIFLVEPAPGGTYRLDGPLAVAVRNFIGCRVWISGPIAPAGEKGGEPATLTVESYGVLAQAAGTTPPAP
jgi:hypothetical protein